MKTSEKDILLIEDFLDGKLNKEQLKAFELKVKSDKDFSRLLEIRKNLEPEYRKASEYEALRKEVAGIIRKENRHFLGIKPAWSIALAASVVLLIGLLIVLQLSNNSSAPSPDIMAESDSVEMLRMDEPENFGLKRVLSVNVIEPVYGASFTPNDSISLKWNSEFTDEAELVIMSETDKVVLIRKRIKLSDSIYTIDKGLLPEGKFTWYIDDTINKGSFKIIK